MRYLGFSVIFFFFLSCNETNEILLEEDSNRMELQAYSKTSKQVVIDKLFKTSVAIFQEYPFESFFDKNFIEKLHKSSPQQQEKEIDQVLSKMFEYSPDFKAAYNHPTLSVMSLDEILELGAKSKNSILSNASLRCIICNAAACENSQLGLYYTNNPLFGIGILIHC